MVKTRHCSFLKLQIVYHHVKKKYRKNDRKKCTEIKSKIRKILILTAGQKYDRLQINQVDHWSNKKEDKMTYAEFFSEIKGEFLKADVSDITEHLAFQFNIIGEAQGIFYIEVNDGILRIEPYVYQERDAMFTCTAETLKGIESGELEPNKAVDDGLLKVEGNIDKAYRLKELIDSHRK